VCVCVCYVCVCYVCVCYVCVCGGGYHPCYRWPSWVPCCKPGKPPAVLLEATMRPATLAPPGGLNSKQCCYGWTTLLNEQYKFDVYTWEKWTLGPIMTPQLAYNHHHPLLPSPPPTIITSPPQCNYHLPQLPSSPLPALTHTHTHTCERTLWTAPAELACCPGCKVSNHVPSTGAAQPHGGAWGQGGRRLRAFAKVDLNLHSSNRAPTTRTDRGLMCVSTASADIRWLV
jgi:hypothetical protein